MLHYTKNNDICLVGSFIAAHCIYNCAFVCSDAIV